MQMYMDTLFSGLVPVRVLEWDKKPALCSNYHVKVVVTKEVKCYKKGMETNCAIHYLVYKVRTREWRILCRNVPRDDFIKLLGEPT